MQCDCSRYTLPPLNFVGGSTQDFMFHCLFYANQKPIDLSDCIATFSVIGYNNKLGKPVIAKRMDIIPDPFSQNPVYNILRVSLLPPETVDMDGLYIYQITIQGPKGEAEIPKQGLIHVINNIHRALIP